MDEIVKLAVAAGRIAAERTPADAIKATEQRLYALPNADPLHHQGRLILAYQQIVERHHEGA